MMSPGDVVNWIITTRDCTGLLKTGLLKPSRHIEDSISGNYPNDLPYRSTSGLLLYGGR